MELIDINGKIIIVGAMAKIPKMPEWLIHDLLPEDVDALEKVEGTIKKIVEIDKYGYVWFGAEDSNNGWFCLKPDEIEII